MVGYDTLDACLPFHLMIVLWMLLLAITHKINIGSFIPSLETTDGGALHLRVLALALLRDQVPQPRHHANRVTIDGLEEARTYLSKRQVLLNSQPGGYYRSYACNQG